MKNILMSLICVVWLVSTGCGMLDAIRGRDEPADTGDEKDAALSLVPPEFTGEFQTSNPRFTWLSSYQPTMELYPSSRMRDTGAYSFTSQGHPRADALDVGFTGYSPGLSLLFLRSENSSSYFSVIDDPQDMVRGCIADGVITLTLNGTTLEADHFYHPTECLIEDEDHKKEDAHWVITYDLVRK